MLMIDGQTFGLSAADLLDRRGYINASECPTICGDDPAKRLRLWQEKTGQVEPEDLSDVLPVQLGSYTEAFNRVWFERVSGLTVTDRGLVIRDEHLRCTLDGMTQYREMPCVWEAKHIGAFSKVDDAVQRYFPQVFVQMHLTRTKQAILSILHGTQNYEWVHVEWDDAYGASVLDRISEFWADVQFKQPPADAPGLPSPKPELFKAYDFSAKNEWTSLEVDWTQNEAAAKKFEKAAKDLKALVPADASEVTGKGTVCKRDKAGKLSIKVKK
jgi:predicted phage-related endonuclease